MEKVVIVTGASRGIGREIARQLARNNMKVVANYNQSEKEAKELKEELEKENIMIDIVKADITRREEAKKLVQFALQKYNKIDKQCRH